MNLVQPTILHLVKLFIIIRCDTANIANTATNLPFSSMRWFCLSTSDTRLSSQLKWSFEQNEQNKLERRKFLKYNIWFYFLIRRKFTAQSLLTVAFEMDEIFLFFNISYWKRGNVQTIINMFRCIWNVEKNERWKLNW